VVASIETVSPRSPDASELIEALDAELRERYQVTETHGLSARDLDDPQTVFLVARDGGQAIACGALRRIDPGIGEVKRMFVRAEFRGRGVSRLILQALETEARKRGIVTLRLETGVRQPEAIGLYRSSGYVQIPVFGEYVGDIHSVCYEKTLPK
jgi:GNAT superfamily N-acetyltransferase